jgi:hypothetical protein
MSITVISYLVAGSVENRDPSLPHICVGDIIKNSTLTASATEVGRSVTSVKSPATYNGWRPDSSSSSVIAEFAAAQDIDYVALFGDVAGITVTAQYSTNGVDYTDIGDAIPGESGIFLALSDTIENVTHIKVVFAGGIPTVYNLSTGLSFIPENGMPVGFAPGSLNFDDKYTNTESVNGQILGRALLRSGVKESVNITAIGRSWIDSNWLDLRGLLRTEGAYIAWNPENYPTEVIYGMASKSPTVTYSDPVYMSIGLEFEGPSYA